MTWLLIVGLILFLGPLRRWAGRHWAFLTSVALGALCGWILGAVVFGMCGGNPIVPLLWAIVSAVAFARVGPAVLRKIDKDGKD